MLLCYNIIDYCIKAKKVKCGFKDKTMKTKFNRTCGLDIFNSSL